MILSLPWILENFIWYHQLTTLVITWYDYHLKCPRDSDAARPETLLGTVYGGIVSYWFINKVLGSRATNTWLFVISSFLVPLLLLQEISWMNISPWLYPGITWSDFLPRYKTIQHQRLRDVPVRNLSEFATPNSPAFRRYLHLYQARRLWVARPHVRSMSEDRGTPIDSTLTPAEANRIIHSHRKVRYGK